MRKTSLTLIIAALLLSLPGPSQAHVPGGKFAVLSFREVVDDNGNFGVTAKVWNYTSTPKRVKVVLEVVVSQYIPTTFTSIDRVATKSTVLRVPEFGTNRKRMYGNFTATGWSFGAENYIYSDVLHAHRAY
jgi:hypothetical protein